MIRIAEDRFNDNQLPLLTTGFPAVGVVLQGEDNAVPFTLGDVTLFAIDTPGTNTNLISSINAQIGTVEAYYTGAVSPLADIASHPGGVIYASSGIPANGDQTDANADDFFSLDDDAGALVNAGDHGHSNL